MFHFPPFLLQHPIRVNPPKGGIFLIRLEVGECLPLEKRHKRMYMSSSLQGEVERWGAEEELKADS